MAAVAAMQRASSSELSTRLHCTLPKLLQSAVLFCASPKVVDVHSNQLPAW